MTETTEKAIAKRNAVLATIPRPTTMACKFCNGRHVYESTDIKTGQRVEVECLFCTEPAPSTESGGVDPIVLAADHPIMTLVTDALVRRGDVRGIAEGRAIAIVELMMRAGWISIASPSQPAPSALAAIEQFFLKSGKFEIDEVPEGHRTCLPGRWLDQSDANYSFRPVDLLAALQSMPPASVHVVMGNDFPAAVYALEADAEAHCERERQRPEAIAHKKQYGSNRIHWRVYTFPLQASAATPESTS